MTIRELLALLETIPDRLLDLEVTVDTIGSGLCHVTRLELDRRRSRFGDVSADRLERKLRLGGRTVWYKEPPEWRLEGWWPAEAAEIGHERSDSGTIGQ